MLEPHIILIRPQMGENIGAAARAMANFGRSSLRIVNPRTPWPDPKAIDMGSGAFDHIQPQIFNSIEDAIADCQYVFATTARKRDLVKPVILPHDAANLTQTKRSAGEKVAFLFGAERTGLTNDEVSLAQSFIRIPSNPSFSSLNLGQAVLLIAYELSLVMNENFELSENDNPPAPMEKLEEFLIRLEDELEKARFFRSENLKPTMIQNIRAFFSRSAPTEQEIKTLHGIVSALIGNKRKSGQ